MIKKIKKITHSIFLFSVGSKLSLFQETNKTHKIHLNVGKKDIIDPSSRERCWHSGNHG